MKKSTKTIPRFLSIVFIFLVISTRSQQANEQLKKIEDYKKIDSKKS